MLNRQVPLHSIRLKWWVLVLYVDFLSFLTEIRKRFKRLVVLVRENKNVDAFITNKTLFYLNNRPN